MEDNIEIKLTNTSKSVTILGAKPIKYVTTKTTTKTAGEITINELITDDLLVM